MALAVQPKESLAVGPWCGTTPMDAIESVTTLTAEWFYYGQYGEIGPLELAQIQELVEVGVIANETIVWRTGMVNWTPAAAVPELQDSLRQNRRPPAPPSVAPTTPNRPPTPGFTPGPTPTHSNLPNPSASRSPYPLLESDKSRVAAGILQLVLPGIGRIYLGYAAIGVLQLVLSLCGVGAVWAWIDGIIILSGGTRLDGYGRELKD